MLHYAGVAIEPLPVRYQPGFQGTRSIGIQPSLVDQEQVAHREEINGDVYLQLLGRLSAERRQIRDVFIGRRRYRCFGFGFVFGNDLDGGVYFALAIEQQGHDIGVAFTSPTFAVFHGDERGTIIAGDERLALHAHAAMDGQRVVLFHGLVFAVRVHARRRPGPCAIRQASVECEQGVRRAPATVALSVGETDSQGEEGAWRGFPVEHDGCRVALHPDHVGAAADGERADGFEFGPRVVGAGT